MQTFLPYLDFHQSARCLDRQRLGKQRVEARQILQTLMGEGRGWLTHPAVKMWRGYEGMLALYGMVACDEWVRRGYIDNTKAAIEAIVRRHCLTDFLFSPPWLGLEKFHASHRACLLAKDPVYYGQFAWREAPAVPDDRGRLPYYWPKGEA